MHLHRAERISRLVTEIHRDRKKETRNSDTQKQGERDKEKLET